jgi:hypothetical protein
MSQADYEIIEDTDQVLCIRDLDLGNRSVTNDAEAVVRELAPALGTRRLEYIDSDGQRDQIRVRDGRFAGFAPAR